MLACDVKGYNHQVDKVSQTVNIQYFIHFKFETCTSIDIKARAAEIFGDNKHLVVMHEGKDKNPHWHFQGYLDIHEEEYIRIITQMAAGHSKKTVKPLSNSVKLSMKASDDIYFLNMMKEGHDSVQHSAEFTAQELERLWKLSRDNATGTEDDLYQYLYIRAPWTVKTKTTRRRESHTQLTTGNQNRWREYITVDCVSEQTLEPNYYHEALRLHAMYYYLEQDKMCPPDVQKLVLWLMMKLARAKLHNPSSMIECVSSRI